MSSDTLYMQRLNSDEHLIFADIVPKYEKFDTKSFSLVRYFRRRSAVGSLRCVRIARTRHDIIKTTFDLGCKLSSYLLLFFHFLAAYRSLYSRAASVYRTCHRILSSALLRPQNVRNITPTFVATVFTVMHEEATTLRISLNCTILIHRLDMTRHTVMPPLFIIRLS